MGSSYADGWSRVLRTIRGSRDQVAPASVEANRPRLRTAASRRLPFQLRAVTS